jgi:hypothetical protein
MNQSSYGQARRVLMAALRVQHAVEPDLAPFVRDGDHVLTLGRFGFEKTPTPDWDDINTEEI